MEAGQADGALPAGLYVVATPIGNLGDITLRALDTLRRADLIICEDTRVTGKLLDRYDIRRPLRIYHGHNELVEAGAVAQRIAAGAAVALVSDAGTPTVSDPGFRAVRACRARGLPVIPIPGPSASLTALAASGLPTDAFLFLGFPPPRSAARQKILRAHADFPHTLIFYESCHRVEKFIGEIRTIFGDGRTVAVARELTKLHEDWAIGPIAEVVGRVKKNLRGEFVVLIAPADFQL
jgi:16S rRNA (cytidine1402-2'-O)-methyltransferase